MKKIHLLEELGLNKNEAIVYDFLLNFGQATASELIKKSDFHRNIVYDNLEKLIDKGLVSYITEGRSKVFHANPPEMLGDFLEKQQEKLDHKKEIAIKLQKDIQRQVKKTTKQDAQIFRGVRGVKFIIKQFIEKKQEYITYGSPQVSNEIMSETYWKSIVNKISSLGTSARVLFNQSQREWRKRFDAKTIIYRFLETEIEPLTQTIICGNQVAIIVWTEQPVTTLITDKNVADSYRDFFELLWKTSLAE